MSVRERGKPQKRFPDIVPLHRHTEITENTESAFGVPTLVAERVTAKALRWIQAIFDWLSRRNEGNKRNFIALLFCAQPVPKALSFISFISAGPFKKQAKNDEKNT